MPARQTKGRGAEIAGRQDFRVSAFQGAPRKARQGSNPKGRHSVRGTSENVRRTFLLDNDPKLAFLCDSLQGGARPIGVVVAEIAEKFGISRRGALYVVERAVRWGLLVRDTTGASGGMVQAAN